MSKRPSDAISIANFDDIFGRTMSLFQVCACMRGRKWGVCEEKFIFSRHISRLLQNK